MIVTNSHLGNFDEMVVFETIFFPIPFVSFFKYIVPFINLLLRSCFHFSLSKQVFFFFFPFKKDILLMFLMSP